MRSPDLSSASTASWAEEASDAGPARGPEGGAELPQEIRDRIPIAMTRAQQKTAAVSPSNPTAARLWEAARTARSARQRVVWLQRWGEASVAPLASTSACRRGCSHCCHIAVQITSVEAGLIAAASGRSAATPPQSLALAELDLADPEALRPWEAAERSVVGQPCPFLVRDECSIYAHRPFACRTHLSLDDDDLLCRLHDGLDIPMPRVDVRLLVGYFLSAQPDAVMADIRAFFPPLSPPAGGPDAETAEGRSR